ncbi:hypothetical protein HPP92_011759 [Vanilla planifolia]|uniref:Uncharacterized protein n=1 Tax=Vanilla planifolia TaxID=51239 RepID=A0A835R194_VANPL|nr:hypothetical protein HPP92_011759 [Vanilla planifolia]
MAPRCLLFQPRNGYGGCIVDPQYAPFAKAVLIPALMAEEERLFQEAQSRRGRRKGRKQQEPPQHHHCKGVGT